MAIFARFIGIDKHSDKHILDLTGAKRDATALWALFCDNMPDIKADLIIDGKASKEGFKKALDETLGVAGSEDTVIISFAGHGTHDHRLVLSDTQLQNLDDSTISMDEIADRFKKSNAKIVLFILDCCFSGSAPARVLEESPIPRSDITSLKELAGKGRILIAASNINEAAWEHPVTRHGLLTKTLIDVLSAAKDEIDLISAMSEIMERVRTEATKLGKGQTPVLFGSIEGGLVIPSLRPGKRFYEAFPEARGVKVSNNIADLKVFGLPEPILKAWGEQFKGGLNNLQLKAVNDHNVLNNESLLVVAPTTSGKTFIGEMAAIRAVMEGKKAVFLLPYRALVNEKYDQFSLMYFGALNLRIIRCTGDYTDQTDIFVHGKYDIAFLTFEMFLNLAIANQYLLNQIGLVVLDEAQFITDINRGINVELLLTYLLTAREKGIAPQIIALSAVIGGINDFDTWLGCKCLITYERPIPLIEGVLDRNGTFQLLDEMGEVKHIQLLAPGLIRQRKEKPSAQDVIVPLVRDLLSKNKNEKVIIFRNQRGTAEGAAGYLAQELGLPPATEATNELPIHDLSSTSANLRSCLGGGTAFHNTNLSREEKAVVERSFRKPDSPIRILAATTTVAAGINTPASTVIIAEQEFIGEDGRAFTVAEYKNMAGRAGRWGFNEKGTAIILADNGNERNLLFNRYVVGKLEEITSSFMPENIQTWLIKLLAQINRILKKEVINLLLNTYGGYLANKKNPQWRDILSKQLEKLLEKMISLGLVSQEGEYIQLTLLGNACGQSALSFESAMRIVELLKSIPSNQISCENLMALVQGLNELDNIYTPVMKRGQKESIRQNEAVERFGPDITRLLQRYISAPFTYYARCKRAAILFDWTKGVPVETIEKQYSTTFFQGRIGYGDIRNIADATRFFLRSAYQIASILLLDKCPGADAMESLLKQLELGIPKDLLELMAIPIPLDRGQYLALHNLGIKTMKDYLAIQYSILKDALGKNLADKLEKLRSSSNK